MRDCNIKSIPNNPEGFTLVEMLVAMAVASIVMMAIYTAYVNHQRSHVTQQLVVDMQQNARAAMSLMKREIRMMGYDPAATDGVDNEDPDDGFIDDDVDPDESAGAGILIAEDDRIQFTADLSYRSEDADVTLPDLSGVNEDLIYTLAGTQLQRNGQIMAYDIEAIGFGYAVDNDLDGVLDLSTNGFILWLFDSNPGDSALDQILDSDDDGDIDADDDEDGKNLAGPQIPINRVRAVRIWLLARTRQPIDGHTDNNTYAVGANHRGPADGDWDPRRKRVLLTTTIYCRNMGI